MIYLFILGFVVYLIMLEALNRGIIRRFVTMNDEVQRIGRNRDIDSRINIAGNDELGALSKSMNEMLRNLASAEKELRQSEMKYRSFVEHFRGIAFRLQRDGTPLYFHGAVCRITGYNENDLMHNNPRWLDLVAVEDADRIKEEISRFLTSHMSEWTTECRIVRADGAMRWLDVVLQNVPIEGGEEPFIQGTCYDATERNEARTKLLESQRALSRLATYLQDTREQERSRMAERIHDDFGQVLLAIKINAAWCNKQAASYAPQIAEKARETVMLIDELMGLVQTMSLELKPSILEHLGLIEAIEWLAERDLRKNGITCKIHATGNTEEEIKSRMSNKMKTALFRIIQEAISNVMRHADAGTVTINLSETPTQILLSIVDDGTGISEEYLQNEKTFGILQMHERAAACGGFLTIKKGDQCGTEVLVCIPK